MAVKSIVDIEINDEAFKRFVGLFKQYDEALKKTPDVWKAVDETAKGTAVTFENMAAALLAQADYAATLSTRSEEHLLKIAGLLEKQKQPVASQAFMWREIARSAGTFAEKITSATVSLLKWSALTGIVSGLLGAGGLFGIDRLAISVGQGRRSSLGFGTSYGEEQAFAANYGRLVDPTAFLGNVNEALHDPQKRVGLFGAGLTQRDIQGKDTAQVANDLLPALKRIVDQTPDAMLASVLRARHLDQFLSLQDAQRLKATPAGELSEYQRQYAANAKLLDLTQQQQKAWQDLQVQLHIAGLEIENSLIKGLTGLTGPITDLSKAFSDAVADFIKSKEAKEWIDDFGGALKWVAAEMQSEDFRKGVHEFTRDVIALAEAAAHALGWLAHKIAPEVPTFDPTVPAPLPLWRRENQPNESPTPGFLGRHLLRPGLPPIWEPASVSPYTRTLFEGIEKADALPSGIINATFGAESSYGKDTSTSSAGAMGPFQFTPDTWRQYGQGGDVQNVGDSAKAAGRYYRTLLDKFGDDPAKAAAAYNWGPKNVAEDVQRYGDSWRQHLPQETQKYVDKILRSLSQQRDKTVLIRVENNTGGNAIIAASVLAV